MDVFSKKKRSEIMSKIRSKNTSIEVAKFRKLRHKGVHFRTHYSKVAGCPDIALPKKKKAVFIDGDFWHGYQFFKLWKTLPNKFWREKISRNIKRDKSVRAKLKRQGWKVLRVWEHELSKEQDKTIRKIILFLGKS